MTFKDLNLIEPIQSALINLGYSVPTPIQQQAIPIILEGKDILGCAQTGTGKTAAFSIPIIQQLVNRKAAKDAVAYQAGRKNRRDIKALILTPTRELAAQIGDSFTSYGKNTTLKHTVVYGGVSQRPQTNAILKGVDILVATPGRLLDLMGQGFIKLSAIEFLVLDEADRMLDMGFITDIERIIERIPSKKQTLLFSATMPEEILGLAQSLLHNPEKVEVTPVSSTVDTVTQSMYLVDRDDKPHLLVDLLDSNDIETALVFTRTKHGAERLVKTLISRGINSDAIHGNKSQNARQKSLNDFKRRKTRVLVATDIASRGIDINQISHVINYDLPEDPETYVHRIGRTGRAGFEGTAYSFCDKSEIGLLKSIQKLIKTEIPIEKESIFLSQECLDRIERIKLSSRPPRGSKNQEEGKSEEAPQRSRARSDRFFEKRRDERSKSSKSGNRKRGDFWKKGRKKSA